MSPFIAQLRTVAQIDSNEWINFLILIIMAALWLFASLIKAASRRKPPQAEAGGPAGQQRESWQQRLARKAEELQRAMEGQSGEGTERMRQRMEERARRQERPAGKITVRSGKRSESIMVYERAEPAADSTREQHAARQREAKEAVSAAGRKAAMTPAEPRPEITRPDLAPAAVELPQVILRAPQTPKLSEESVEARHEPVAGYEPASVIDSSDPDALRKAILHYEILGKPIGLRDPPEQSTIF